MRTGVIVFGPCGLGSSSLFWSLAYEYRRRNKSTSFHVPRNYEWISPLCLKKNSSIQYYLDSIPSVHQNSACVLDGSTLLQNKGPLDLPFSSLFLFFHPTLPDLFRVKKCLKNLYLHGFKKEDIRLVLIGAGIPGGLSRDLIQEAMGNSISELRFAPRQFLEAENQRKVLQEINPRSDVVHMIARWVEQDYTKVYKKTIKAGNQQFLWMESRQRLVNRLWEKLTDNKIRFEKIEDEIERVLKEEFRDNESNSKLFKEKFQEIKKDLLGFGPLERYLNDPAVNEIMVNGEKDIFIEKDQQIQKGEGRFINRRQLDWVMERMVRQAGRRLDHAEPLCNVRLPDGSRANFVLPPVSLQGPVLTIRRFSKEIRTFSEILKNASITSKQEVTLKNLVRSRKNILIAGNSGSGKTTLLNILSTEIPPQERIITIEDTAELNFSHRHVVRFETRSPNSEGKGEITMRSLVLNALRMRPDRIIVGECRGDEVIPMIQSLNTGHHGSMVTLHANSAEDALKRLESMILLGAPNWPIDVIRNQIEVGIDVILFMKREGSRRWLDQIKIK